MLRNRVRQDGRSAGRRRAREHRTARAVRVAATDDLVAEADLGAALAGAVTELPEREREVVLLRFYRDRSLAAIARELGTSEATVRRRLASALERLESRLADAAAEAPERWERALVALARPRRSSATLAATVATAALAGVAVLGTALGLRALVAGDAAPQRVATARPVGADPGRMPAAVALAAAAPVAPSRARRPVEVGASAQEPRAASGWEVLLRDAQGRPAEGDGRLVAVGAGGRTIEGLARVAPDRYRIPVRARGLVRVGVRQRGFAFANAILDARESTEAPDEPTVITLRRGRLLEVVARVVDAAGPAPVPPSSPSATMWSCPYAPGARSAGRSGADGRGAPGPLEVEARVAGCRAALERVGPARSTGPGSPSTAHSSPTRTWSTASAVSTPPQPVPARGADARRGARAALRWSGRSARPGPRRRPAPRWVGAGRMGRGPTAGLRVGSGPPRSTRRAGRPRTARRSGSAARLRPGADRSGRSA